ncbi:MAG: DNA ligase [Burkholderiales bacterium]|nr:DNA ligase [Burkholderiales bacterium]
MLAPSVAPVIGLLAGKDAQAASSTAADPVPPPLLLAKVAGPQVDVARYLVSEKLDGVRAYWTGERLLFRRGAAIRAPAWFTERLPHHPLDGELWLARGRFNAVSGLLRQEQSADDPLWRAVSYKLFELPGTSGGFARRVGLLAQVTNDPALRHVQVTEQRRLSGPAELQRWLAEVIAAGGEGLMLHEADAPYVTGRSEVLLKLKPQLDAEAVVIAHLPGKGRHTGRLGALQVSSEDGRTFAIGSGLTDELRDHPPAIGSIVVYRYRGLTSRGLPRFATFWRMAEAQ